MEATTRDVEAAKAGDQNAYARLVQRHQRVVTSITLAITTDVTSSEDAAQEAFLAGWRDLQSLDDPKSFSAWICQIARNRAYDIVRKRNKAGARTADADLESAVDPDPGALDALVQAESSRLIAGALQALPPESREAMILFYREGESIAQVAEALGVSEDVVKKRLSRARERIRKSVETALGAALVASVANREMYTVILTATSSMAGAAGAAASAAPGRASSAWSTFKTAAATATKVAAAGAAVAVAATVIPPRLQQQVTTVAITRPAEIRGTISGAKDVMGTMTFDFGNGDVRTVKIEGSKFSPLVDVPHGSVTVTTDLENYPDPVPATKTMTIRKGEHLTLNITVVTDAKPKTPARRSP